MRAWPIALLLLLACNGRASPPDAGTMIKTPPPAQAPPERPYALHVPRDWDGTAPLPLVVFFHGYGSSGAGASAALGLEAMADAAHLALAVPEGSIDAQGRRFWSATDVCCDFGGTGVDDVAYARWLLDDAAARLPVDPKRVYVMGHSNGAFLALRLGCELAPRLAGVVSLAGAGWKDPSRCAPAAPVSVLEVHGDADRIVRMTGGQVFDQPGRDYPGVMDTLAPFGARDGCTGPLAPSGPPLHFDALLSGRETTVQELRGCAPGFSVGLWTVAGGTHLPQPTPGGLAAIASWMAAHPRP